MVYAVVFAFLGASLSGALSPRARVVSSFVSRPLLLGRPRSFNADDRSFSYIDIPAGTAGPVNIVQGDSRPAPFNVEAILCREAARGTASSVEWRVGHPSLTHLRGEANIFFF